MTALYVTLGFIFVGWYIVNFIRDMTRKDPEELLKKQEDEDIDISDEVRQFQPVLIEKDPKKGQMADKVQNVDVVTVDNEKSQKAEMNGNHSPDKTDTQPPSSDNIDDEPTNRRSVSDIDDNKKNPDTDKVVDEVTEQKSSAKPLRSNIVIDTKPRIRTPDTPRDESLQQDKPLVRIKDESLLNITTPDKAENINPDLSMIRIDMDYGNSATHYVGAVNADDLPSLVNEIAERGKDSRMGKIFAAWEVCEQKEDSEDIRRVSKERKAKGTSPPPISMPTL